MKYLIVLTLLAACAPSYKAQIETKESCKIVENLVVCPDGSYIEIPGPALPENEIDLSNTIVAKNSCVEIGPNLYVENIQSGKFFDVYSNPNCFDSQGEHCDNVETAYGSSGSGGQGAARICWVGAKQISGIKLGNGDIDLYIVDFH